MTLSAMFAAGGITVTAFVAMYGVWRSIHNDKAAEHTAVIEAQTGQTGQVIEVLKFIIDTQNIDLRQLRTDLNECLSRQSNR